MPPLTFRSWKKWSLQSNCSLSLSLHKRIIFFTTLTLLINFIYWSVLKTAETNASRPRPRLQNFGLETKTAVSRTTRLVPATDRFSFGFGYGISVTAVTGKSGFGRSLDRLLRCLPVKMSSLLCLPRRSDKSRDTSLSRLGLSVANRIMIRISELCEIVWNWPAGVVWMRSNLFTFCTFLCSMYM